MMHFVNDESNCLDTPAFSSFRAVIGVAHHFSQMKSQFAQVFSALAIIRSLRWLCHKILYMFGVRNVDPSTEQIWATVSEQLGAAQNGLTEGDIKSTKSNWPIIMFVVVVFGAPWLIWRMLMSVTGMQSPDMNGKAVGLNSLASCIYPALKWIHFFSIVAKKQWVLGKGEHYVAIAVYDFTKESDQEITIRSGQTLRLAPKGKLQILNDNYTHKLKLFEAI